MAGNIVTLNDLSGGISFNSDSGGGCDILRLPTSTLGLVSNPSSAFDFSSRAVISFFINSLISKNSDSRAASAWSKAV